MTLDYEEIGNFSYADNDVGTLYTIPGNPIPNARPRHTKNGFTYDSQKALKQPLITILKTQHKSKKPFSGPLKLIILFLMEIPKTKKKSVKPGDYHWIKPDLDNLEKMTLDLMADAQIFKDAQVAHVSKCKKYSAEPGTIIYVKEL